MRRRRRDEEQPCCPQLAADAWTLAVEDLLGARTPVRGPSLRCWIPHGSSLGCPAASWDTPGAALRTAAGGRGAVSAASFPELRLCGGRGQRARGRPHSSSPGSAESE